MRIWRAIVAAAVAVVVMAAPAHAEFGLVPRSFTSTAVDAGGQPELRAGAHPDRLLTRFEFQTDPDGKVDANVKDVALDLPVGLTGDPNAVPACTRADFDRVACPPESQVGVIRARFALLGEIPLPIYNVVAYDGVAELGFPVIVFPFRFVATIDAVGRYGTRIELRDVSQQVPLVGGEVELWGVPADHQADTRAARRPFLTNPTRCDREPPTTTLRVRSWQDPGRWLTATSAAPGPLSGCADVPFSAGLAVALDSPAADTPSGLRVELQMPQSDAPDGRGTSHLDEVAITLPQGMSLSPGVADGLTACDDAQLHVGSAEPPACPESSKVGSAELVSPALAQPLDGELFIGRQLPADSYRLFITARGKGFTVKLAGSLRADARTGQLTAVFGDLPELPVSTIALRFKGGPRAPLATPSTCGTRTVVARLTPYRGPPVVTATADVATTSGPGGAICTEVAPFAPSFTAGSTPARAGRQAAFSVTVRRSDGEEPLERVRLTLPPGLMARLAGVERCPATAALTAACPPGSRVGSVTVETGVGPAPKRLSGTAYLTGPQRGAPFGLALTVRALAGPLDLGTIVVLARLTVDPVDGHVTIATDALPGVVAGIPLRLQTLAIDVDRPGFMRNPTSCRATEVRAAIRGTAGTTVEPTARYAVGGCRSLRFRPQVSVALEGRRQLRRRGHPTVRIGVRGLRRGANASAAEIALPRSLALDENAVTAICSLARARDGRCPGGSRVGSATIRTPLLRELLTGPVHVVQPEGGGLPDLWATVAGGGVRLGLRSATVVARDRSVRAKFEQLPDVPLSSLSLQLRGGARGLLSLTQGLCRSGRPLRLTAHATLQAHNGRRSSKQLRVQARPRCRR